MTDRSEGVTHITRVWRGRRVEARRGHALPLGASEVPGGVNFALFSRNASSVVLVLSGADGKPWFELPLHPRFNRTGDVWHVLVPDLVAPFRYSFRVAGPAASEGAGHRFDPGRPLVDPYAHAARLDEGVWAGLFFSDGFDWGSDAPLNIPVDETVIYELHVRGFTRHPSSGISCPGTFAAVVEKIAHLKELGVTAVELMPVAAFDAQTPVARHPVSNRPLTDFWGYNPVAFFAPQPDFAVGGLPESPVLEFREMVRALHEAGIEVILDVVFNHTGEGKEAGPVSSFRGLDNSIYYLLGPDGSYLNFSGCGNTLNCNHPVVRNLLRDCLRYWVTEMHVDGFRFDLASILGRGGDGSVLPNPPVLEEIAQDPVLAGVKIIAEAWDAAGLYQVGLFPRLGRWAEWNGKFRDDVRRFVRGDHGQVLHLARRLEGSPDLYGGRGPACPSVNFVTCHDGFTLSDLVSYAERRNEANGEGNRDGLADNFSWNCGAEGPSEDPAVLALRRRQVRNLLAILLLSRGVPMILAGDEFGRSQGGNNNPWCQDNPTGWVDWEPTQAGRGLLRFLRELIRFRQRHPACRTGPGEVEFHGVKAGSPDFSHPSRSLAARFRAQRGGEDVWAAFNAWEEPLDFELPEPSHGTGWRRAADTSLEPPQDFLEPGREAPVEGRSVRVQPFSTVILVS